MFDFIIIRKFTDVSSGGQVALYYLLHQQNNGSIKIVKCNSLQIFK